VNNPRTLERVGTAAVWLLIIVGVGASLSRYLLPAALHAQIARPLYSEFARDQLPVLAAHPVPELLHRVGGSIYLLLGATQFMPRLRARHLTLHRWCGRAFLALTLLAGSTGVFMALAFPYDAEETAPTVLFGTIMVGCGVMAYVRARRREVARHREWVMRCFSVGLGISTIRLIFVGLLYTTSLPMRTKYVVSFWLGWTLTLLAAEAWIRLSRAPQAVGVPAG
jgi:FtsH-binding integral membrane protein